MGNYKSGNADAKENLAKARSKGGRPKGSKAKINNEMKKDMVWVYKHMEGKKGLKDWAKTNKGEFYHHLIKATIPKESEVKADVNVTFTWIKDDTGNNGPL